MHRILFEIAQLKIYSYGFLVAMGFFIGFLLALKKAKKDNIDEDAMYSIVILIIVSALVGGRVFYIVLNWKHFLAEPKIFLFSREGFVRICFWSYCCNYICYYKKNPGLAACGHPCSFYCIRAWNRKVGLFSQWLLLWQTR